jgi:hypothetical protein
MKFVARGGKFNKWRVLAVGRGINGGKMYFGASTAHILSMVIEMKSIVDCHQETVVQ